MQATVDAIKRSLRNFSFYCAKWLGCDHCEQRLLQRWTLTRLQEANSRTFLSHQSRRMSSKARPLPEFHGSGTIFGRPRRGLSGLSRCHKPTVRLHIYRSSGHAKREKLRFRVTHRDFLESSTAVEQQTLHVRSGRDELVPQQPFASRANHPDDLRRSTGRYMPKYRNMIRVTDADRPKLYPIGASKNNRTAARYRRYPDQIAC
ncbi:hypothetical protein GGR52DRAFT_214190 [Hypoxylon sp. FL1284]|nr:hypothetical protein GGR52DRAFT_214190 [Hypoxylon sp. FL1284]